MSQIVLVSWENERVQIPAEKSDASGFIKHCPNLDEEIMLKELEIDTATLKLIKEFLMINQGEQFLTDPFAMENNVVVENHAIQNFFDGISVEELHLLVLAAYKLDFKDLQMGCSFRIAQMFLEIPKNEIERELSVDELTINEEDYLKYTHQKRFGSFK